MKKTLTILAGHPRGGEATWSTLYENVLTPLDSDLAISKKIIKDYLFFT